MIQRVTAVAQPTLEQLVRDWERALVRQELSPKTVRSYDWSLQGFLRFAERDGVIDCDELSRELIEQWQDDIRGRLSRRSRSMASVALRQFLRWGVGRGLVNERAPYWVTRVKGARGKPRPIANEFLRVVLRHLARPDFAGSLVDLRDRALFLYILSTGGRVSEVLQVRRDEAKRAIVEQKGGDEKTMIAPPIVVDALQEYLAERRDTNPWMWVTLDYNHSMRPLNPGGVREIWRRLARRLGVPPWTTHQLRHTGASELYEAGIDGLVVADWLGHKGLNHATQYTRVSWRRRQEAIGVFQKMIEREAGIPKEVARRERPSRRRLSVASSEEPTRAAQAGQPASEVETPWSTIAGAL